MRISPIKDALAPWGAVVERVDATCAHVTMPAGFKEEGLYDARERVQNLGYGTLIYHSDPAKKSPHFGVFAP